MADGSVVGHFPFGPYFSEGPCIPTSCLSVLSQSQRLPWILSIRSNFRQFLSTPTVWLSCLFKRLSPLQATYLCKSPERIYAHLPLRESRKNLGGILWWPFVGLKQQFADLLRGGKNLGARCKADARHD